MRSSYHILPECYADTLLVSILGFKGANHKSSIGQVAIAMERNYKNQLAIGLVDNDKVQPRYFKQFEVLKDENDLFLKQNPKNKHYLIVVSPAFEKWTFSAAEAVNIDPAEYGFKSLKYFKAVCKSANVSKNQNVKQFINTIKQKKSPHTETMINWLLELL